MRSEPAIKIIPKRHHYTKKRPIKAIIVAVLHVKRDKRGLDLMLPISRAVSKDEVHELIATDEKAGPGRRVDRVAGVGFFETRTSGVVLVGDTVTIEGKDIGKIVGFDETHFPNHLNFVMRVNERKTGSELYLRLGDRVTIGKKGNRPA